MSVDRYAVFVLLIIYEKKIAFQWDGYRLLLDYIPACTVQRGSVPAQGGTCLWSG